MAPSSGSVLAEFLVKPAQYFRRRVDAADFTDGAAPARAAARRLALLPTILGCLSVLTGVWWGGEVLLPGVRSLWVLVPIGLALTLVQWLIGVLVLHGVARLLGARARLAHLHAVLGFTAVPGLLAMAMDAVAWNLAAVGRREVFALLHATGRTLELGVLVWGLCLTFHVVRTVYGPSLSRRRAVLVVVLSTVLGGLLSVEGLEAHHSIPMQELKFGAVSARVRALAGRLTVAGAADMEVATLKAWRGGLRRGDLVVVADVGAGGADGMGRLARVAGLPGDTAATPGGPAVLSGDSYHLSDGKARTAVVPGTQIAGRVPVLESVRLAALGGIDVWSSAFGRLQWPETGLPVTPGDPSEVVAGFLEGLRRNDPAEVSRHVVIAADAGSQEFGPWLRRMIQFAGPLDRWMMVNRTDGDVFTVYCRFRRADLAMEVGLEQSGDSWLITSVTSTRQRHSWREPVWKEGASAHLRLRAWPGFGAAIAVLAAADQAIYEQALAALCLQPDAVPAALAAPVEVMVFNSRANLHKALGIPIDDRSLGLWDRQAIYLVPEAPAADLARPEFARALVSTCTHEMTHALVTRYTHHRSGGKIVEPPWWLGEGLALLGERGHLVGKRDKIAAELKQVELPSIDGIARAKSACPLCLTATLMEYLTVVHGRDAPRRILDALCADRSPDQAVEAVTGRTMKELTADWHEWLRGGMVRGK
jgi:hypothetical protein